MKEKGSKIKSIWHFAACLGLAAFAFSIHVAAQGGNVEQTLLQLERDWEQANAKNDLTALDRILAQEFVNTDSDGLTTKAEVMARRKSGAVKYTAFTQDDYKVHVFGDTAVVTGRSTSNGTRDSKTTVLGSGSPMCSCVAMAGGRRSRRTPAALHARSNARHGDFIAVHWVTTEMKQSHQRLLSIARDSVRRRSLCFRARSRCPDR